MSQNQDTHDARIADKAYALWEADGKPEGQSQNHWELARQFIMEQDARSGGSAAMPNSENSDANAPRPKSLNREIS